MTKMGRPTDYSPELAKRICDLISITTKGMRRLHKEYDWFPHPDTVNEWRWYHKDFSEQYTEAYKKKAELLAEEIQEIADDASEDYIETEKGLTFNPENIQRARLRVDTRKWIACKLLPKVYGEKLETTHKSDVLEDWLDKMKEVK